MAKQEEEEAKSRGVFERPPGSGVWWIVYYIDGQRHREIAGKKSAAIALYSKRKEDARAGRKLPTLRKSKVVTFGELMEDAVAFAVKHLRTHRDYSSKAQILAEPFGRRSAADLTHQEIEVWISGNKKENNGPGKAVNGHCKTPATANRYRAFFSTVFREGQRNGKVAVNPARLIRPLREDNARARFLTRDEFFVLLEIIRRDHSAQVPSFIVATYSAMRWSEQFNITWSQVDFDGCVIRDVVTKTNSLVKVRKRSVPLNSVTIAALKEQKVVDGKNTGPSDIVFPRVGQYSDWDWWLKPALKEAKVKDIVWHSLRHTCLSWAAMSGSTMKEVQELGGHLTISQAARYMHLSPAHTGNASERMAHWATKPTATTTATR
jgi:integrase